MHCLSLIAGAALLAGYVSGLSANGESNPNRAAVLEAREEWRRAQMIEDREILSRRKEEISFCYGSNSICGSSNDLFALCDQFESQSDLTQWYQCLCGNGYVSTREACGWCTQAYNLTNLDTSARNSAQCSSFSATIAPIPTNVLALQSSQNATYTGAPPVFTGDTTPGSSGVRTTSGTGSRATTSGRASSTRTGASTTSTFTVNGGAVPTVSTSNNGGQTPATVTVTAAGPTGTSGAQGRDTENAMAIAIGVFGLLAAVM